MLKVKKFKDLEIGNKFWAQNEKIYEKICPDSAATIEGELIHLHENDPTLTCADMDLYEMATKSLEDKLKRKLFFHKYKSSRFGFGERALLFHHIEALYNDLLPFMVTEINESRS